MDIKQSIGKFREELSKELTENILRYWATKMVDNVNGGFYGQRDGHDQLIENADKGVILNTRILWTFSKAAKHSVEYKLLANRAYRYLVDHFIDKEKGGVYWMVDYRGNPVDNKETNLCAGLRHLCIVGVLHRHG